MMIQDNNWKGAFYDVCPFMLLHHAKFMERSRHSVDGVDNCKVEREHCNVLLEDYITLHELATQKSESNVHQCDQHDVIPFFNLLGNDAENSILSKDLLQENDHITRIFTFCMLNNMTMDNYSTQ
eukprot:scaffold37393_cov155-Skeletonema_dohrnii-CCMP3373.AAC.1